MKTKTILQHLTLAGAIMVGGAHVAAADEEIIANFDFDLDFWTWAWGPAGSTVEHDPTVDADDNPASGSMKITVNWATDNLNWQDGQVQKFFAYEPALYDRIAYDIKVDTANSTLSAGGNYEGVTIVMREPWTEMAAKSLPNTNGWIHVEAALPAGLTAKSLMHVRFYPNPNNNGFNFAGPITYWVDNIKFISESPVLAIKPKGPGLDGVTVAATQLGGYQRQNVRSVNGNYPWAGAAGPVTYSLTMTNNTGTNNFEANLVLVGNQNNPGGYADYNPSNVVYLQFYTGAEGAISATARFKTNQPTANSQYWQEGHSLVSANATNLNGTWSLTFGTAGDLTLTAPDGTFGTGTFPADALPFFDQQLYVYFGVNPNGTTNSTTGGNPSVTFTRCQISGVASPLDDDFTVFTNWNANVALDPSGVTWKPPGALHAIEWTYPANNYVLEQSGDLQSWSPAVSVPQGLRAGDVWRSYITSGGSPGNAGYYRLNKTVP